MNCVIRLWVDEEYTLQQWSEHVWMGQKWLVLQRGFGGRDSGSVKIAIVNNYELQPHIKYTTLCMYPPPPPVISTALEVCLIPLCTTGGKY